MKKKKKKGKKEERKEVRRERSHYQSLTKSDRSYSGLDYHFEKFRDEKKNGI